MIPEIEKRILEFDKYPYGADMISSLLLKFLSDQNVDAKPFAGKVDVRIGEIVKSIPLHFWLQANNKIIDLRLAKSLGLEATANLPFGVFDPNVDSRVEYQGFQIQVIPMTDDFYQKLIACE